MIDDDLLIPRVVRKFLSRANHSRRPRPRKALARGTIIKILTMVNTTTISITITITIIINIVTIVITKICVPDTVSIWHSRSCSLTSSGRLKYMYMQYEIYMLDINVLSHHHSSGLASTCEMPHPGCSGSGCSTNPDPWVWWSKYKRFSILMIVIIILMRLD